MGFGRGVGRGEEGQGCEGYFVFVFRCESLLLLLCYIMYIKWF